jgi:integrase
MEMAATAHLTVIAPDNEKFTVQLAPARLPRRKPNAEYRSREHLTEREVEKLIEAAKGNRWGHRDATMVLIAFRHGLRALELVDLRWEQQVDLEHALLHVRRLKNGSPATHPLTGKELRALRRLQREQDTKSPFVFTSERGTPFTKRGFQAMVERAGKAIGFDVKIHPHMLRHACGFKLANDGVDTRTIQAYLGNKSIQHTVRYTELAPTRFKSLFRD